MNQLTRIPTDATQPAQCDFGAAAVAWETARLRKRNGIPDGFLTPSYIELAVAKAFTPLPDGSFTPERLAAEAAVAGVGA